MSADLLREAAALMRSRADTATPGRWDLHYDGIYVNKRPDPDFAGGSFIDAQVLDVGDEDYPDELVTLPDAQHIVGMQPAVALAVADWLDAEAASHHPHKWDAARLEQALAVARAYLGRDA